MHCIAYMSVQRLHVVRRSEYVRPHSSRNDAAVWGVFNEKMDFRHDRFLCQKTFGMRCKPVIDTD
jgi:hypothetical protein